MSERQQSKSDKDDWQTPHRVLRSIKATTGVDMDPCAGPGTDIGDINITEDQDGLSYPWEGYVYVNPPFSDKGTWLDKAIEEYQKKPVDAIYFLTPDSTDVKSWWHGKIAKHADWTLFYEGRVKFYDPALGEQRKSPPGGVGLHIFGNVPNLTLEMMAEQGDLLKRPRFL